MRRTACLVVTLASLAGCGNPLYYEDDTPPFGDDAGPPTSPFEQPVFPAPVSAAVAPPPISGGTLAVLSSGKVVASDPDRDHVYVVDLLLGQKIADIALAAGDEPGRIVEDGAGRVHVALRSGGAVVTIDPSSWTITARQAVCPAPRGLAWDPTGDLIHVACSGGELVSLPAAGGAPTRTVQLDRDLRDIVILPNDQLSVSRLRTAELLTLDATGAVIERQQPVVTQSFEPDGAWRTVASGTEIFMLHQRASSQTVGTVIQGGYGGPTGCFDSIVHSAITVFEPGSATSIAPVVLGATVPVDLALSHDGTTVAVLSAGNAYLPGAPVVVTMPRGAVESGGPTCGGNPLVLSGQGEPIAIAYTAHDQLVVQYREPAQLIVAGSSTPIALSSDSRLDTGLAMFHANSGGGIACASCHFEGGDDGRVWSFDIGNRRTQALRGGIAGTEPFHWAGDEPDFPTLFEQIFVDRMGGPETTSDGVSTLEHWVDRIPLIPKAPGDAAAIARGKALFEDVNNVGCTTCHNGAKLTNNATVNVGTGGAFQVPRLLGLVEHPPYLHDGVATTLADRFTAAGGDMHGHTSQLTPAQISDLIAYLDSL
ncbi:MAG TPA: c-type cytochrome [Kofleriaceae bacterium]|nr:c-type cytochrome [Kofleriaceae bacterium]